MEGVKEVKEEEGRCIWKKFSHEELERQYSPSRWSSRFDRDHIIPKHVEEAQKRSDIARKTVPSRLNICYAPGCPRAALDVYGEDLADEAPLLVYVHGGYWQQLNKDVSGYLVPPLHKAGVVVVVVGYDLAPQVGVADIVQEIRMGVAWACKLARGRGSAGVVLSGWSAGGQLVTQVLTEEGSPKAAGQGHTQLTPYRDLIRGVVTFSGVFDLRPLVTTYVNDQLKLTPESAWALSPLRGVGELARVWSDQGRPGGVLRLLVLAGEQESPEFIRQSKEYCQACVSAGLRGECVVIGGADHFSLVCDLFLEDYTQTSRLQTFVNACCGRNKD